MTENTKIGNLTIGGVGITAIAHLTLETIGHVRDADVVFHNFAGQQAAHIRTLNSNALSVEKYYGKDQVRTLS